MGSPPRSRARTWRARAACRHARSSGVRTGRRPARRGPGTRPVRRVRSPGRACRGGGREGSVHLALLAHVRESSATRRPIRVPADEEIRAQSNRCSPTSDTTRAERPSAGGRPTEPSDDRPDRPTDAHRPVVVATDLHHAARLDVTFHSDDNRPRCPCRPRSARRRPSMWRMFSTRFWGFVPTRRPDIMKDLSAPHRRRRDRTIANAHRGRRHAHLAALLGLIVLASMLSGARASGGDASPRVLLSVRSSGGRGHGRDLAEWFQDRWACSASMPTGQHAVRHRGARGSSAWWVTGPDSSPIEPSASTTGSVACCTGTRRTGVRSRNRWSCPGTPTPSPRVSSRAGSAGRRCSRSAVAEAACGGRLRRDQRAIGP